MYHSKNHSLFHSAVTNDISSLLIADNVAYGDNAVQMNTYDETKAVYEPVKDNETSVVKDQVRCICFFQCYAFHKLYIIQLLTCM